MNSTPQATSSHVTTAEIMSMLKPGDTPLEFIKNNLTAPPTATPPVNPQALSNEMALAQARAEGEAKAASAVNSESKPETVPSKEGEVAASTVEDKTVEFMPDVGEDKKDVEVKSESTDDDTEVPGAQNFKALRKSLNETKTRLKERETELAEIAAKVRAYETGEAFPEELEKREAEISRLKQFEKVVNLKTSSEYQEKFVRPLKAITDKLGSIAKDYNIPQDIINQVFKIENKAQLNRFLEDHFDAVGALEVKQLVEQAGTIQAQAAEAEKEPDTAMEKFQQEAARLREERLKGQRAVMREISRGAWSKSMSRIKDEGKAIELIAKDGDVEHNQKYVKPIVDAAAKEYGKLVYMLVENGLEKLPEDLAEALARMCQLAHASAVALDTRSAALDYADKISKNVERSAAYIRPSLGSGGGIASQPDDLSKIETVQDASNYILNKVMSRRNG